MLLAIRLSTGVLFSTLKKFQDLVFANNLGYPEEYMQEFDYIL